jgi:hypothetical protein
VHDADGGSHVVSVVGWTKPWGMVAVVHENTSANDRERLLTCGFALRYPLTPL